ncbi:MAG: DUF5723 family protein [Bacteroidales bacterium]|nr:DUF5723 family protein [Bacteroidales bacterium]MCF8344705.1 DUF5723 family protein [Bacteroidales bacterium]MCF8349780.1 DUF5723 family protein [Bacteroidales bacterium]MCF8376299.1 DUF5723 family protein [Bacteroidales bacterium]MCF8400993.1 DUF5723 family protein [Bacteroidales bacterium]
MRLSLKLIYLLLFVAFSFKPAPAQEQLGLVTGNYAGINGLTLNPSSGMTSKLYLDVNIASANVFSQNNFLYMRKENYYLPDFFKKGYQLPLHPVEGIEGDRPFYLYGGDHPKQFHTYVEAMGPSFMVSNNQISYGLYTSSRVVSNVRNLPLDMANFFYYGIGYDPQHMERYSHKDKYTISALGYTEIGLVSSYTFKGYSKEMISVGGAFKLLYATTGIHYKGGPIDYMVPDGETINIYNFNGDINYAAPLDYSNNQLGGDRVQGRGVAFDLGITFQKNYSWPSNVRYRKPCFQRYEKYKYRIGLSLLDIGKIWFNENARSYSYVNSSGVFNNADSIQNLITTPDELIQQMNNHLCGSEDCKLPANSFFMNPPAAVSLQFDYHIKENWYVNSTYIQSLPVGAYQVYRPSVLAVIPRYESRILEVAVPVSLYDYEWPRLGLAVRIYNLTIGTEKLTGFFNYWDFSGLDLYVGLKFNLEKGFCRGKYRAVPCPDLPEVQKIK